MNPRAIPFEIVVVFIIGWLGWKVIRWWTEAMNAKDENVRLRADNERLSGALEILVDAGQHPADTVAQAKRDVRTALTTKQRRKPQVGDDIKWP